MIEFLLLKNPLNETVTEEYFYFRFYVTNFTIMPYVLCNVFFYILLYADSIFHDMCSWLGYSLWCFRHIDG